MNLIRHNQNHLHLKHFSDLLAFLQDNDLTASYIISKQLIHIRHYLYRENFLADF